MKPKWGLDQKTCKKNSREKNAQIKKWILNFLGN